MLKIKDLSFSYGNEKVISEFTLSLPSRGVYSIMGPSGCGKSTLFSLISGLKTPQSGSIELASKSIAFAFQEPRLLPWLTAADNVNLVLGGKKSTLKTAIKALDEVGLLDGIKKYPDELSGGMQKRVSLARAFVTNSDFLLLDEPFTGLDDETKKNIITKIKAIGEESLVLLITHDTAEAKACSDMVFSFSELNKKEN